MSYRIQLLKIMIHENLESFLRYQQGYHKHKHVDLDWQTKIKNYFCFMPVIHILVYGSNISTYRMETIAFAGDRL